MINSLALKRPFWQSPICHGLPTFWCTIHVSLPKQQDACSMNTTSTHNPHNQHAQSSHHGLLLIVLVIIVVIDANILAQWQQRRRGRWRQRRQEGEGQGDGTVFCRKPYPGHLILFAVVDAPLLVSVSLLLLSTLSFPLLSLFPLLLPPPLCLCCRF
jgi:hypothetical protein